MTVAAIGATVTALATPGANAKAPDDPTARAYSQIAALQQLKQSLTPAERKLDSRLAVELRKRGGQVAANTLPQLGTGVEVSKSGTTEVEVHAEKVGDELISRLRAIGAGIRFPSAATGTVLVEAPLTALPEIAGWKDVTSVNLKHGLISARQTDPNAKKTDESKQTKAARIETAVRAAQAAPKVAAAPQGAVVSEGDRTHAADTARTRYKVTGTGVKVCALSDGVDSLAASKASGDLPADLDVLPGQEGSGDEGTAMLEIIHDLVPNAKLGFATAFTSEASFADNIRALRFTAGCDIIVDDVVYYHESPFQDGLPARAVNDVTADGAYYFSSAGNEGNTLDGTSGNWEGDFADSGRGIGKFAGAAHDFDPGTGVQEFNPLSPNSAGQVTTLWWADALEASANDYDLYVLNSLGNVTSFSQDVQNGDDDPFEILRTGAGAGQRLAVVKFSGEARYFQLSAFRGRFADSTDGLKGFSTPGVTRGHNSAVGAFSVAATPAKDPLPFALETGDPANPAGPYPNVHTRQSKPERFTSDGPRRVFFNADGTPITPGDFTSTGGAVRAKPQITAADGVATSVADFAPFFGTSAAAPHAAAIAALALSGNPGLSNDEIRTALQGTALDLAPAGSDNRTGHGVIRADLLLRNTGATPQPLVRAGTPTVTPTTGDGDAFLEPGEQAKVTVPAENIGDGTATGVNVVLDPDHPGATVTPRARSYGNLAAGASKSRDYTVKLAADYPLGRPVTLKARVTFAGTLSPTTGSLLVATGQPSATVRDFAYTGAPVPIPDNDPTGASVTVDVSGVGFASGITFSIDGTACSTDTASATVGLDHTWVGDLVATLTGPGGRTATLFARDGAGGNNLCQVVFDDAATTAFASVTSSNAPYTGTWRPDDPLAPFRASSADGTWTFTVADRAGSDTGSIRAFSLHVTGFEPA
ncbi:S8 family serine peptidase [Actinoplanes sp. NEAU-A12]|uniref:S8 family serine peptidase n=1 Tax=Actinoplanes sandaracinus TaxID=3045177 RepID=A0ABT6WI13_9ACTN|nr:S8 family serine peptidase [Actinoplanes sandaracinus]MDI6099358.1 S8 family serine peptidase [Actinoplanes sandaracinus]